MSGSEPALVDDLAVFSAAPFDMLEDVCGDPAADLAVLLAGNQYMVLPDLVASFSKEVPEVGRVFYETLPPGVILQQFRRGGLRLGSLELRVAPDVLVLSPSVLQDLHGEGLVGEPATYASNDLALLVARGNPEQVLGWSDLARPGVRCALPDPRTEGIGELVLEAIEAAGGPSLRAAIEIDKAARGEVVFTTIHHRQSPAWLASGDVDVIAVWSTEARHHLALGSPFEKVTLPAQHNRTGSYATATVNAAPHPEAARRFVDHLVGAPGRAVYGVHGFDVTAPAVWSISPALGVQR